MSGENIQNLGNGFKIHSENIHYFLKAKRVNKVKMVKDNKLKRVKKKQLALSTSCLWKV